MNIASPLFACTARLDGNLNLIIINMLSCVGAVEKFFTPPSNVS